MTFIALVLALRIPHTVGHAADSMHSLHPLNGANVFVEPYWTPELWSHTLDPALVGGLDDVDVVQKIYAGLVKQVYDDRTRTFHIVPELAARLPAVSADGRTYTFVLRKDTRFSDGTPITAQDVVYSLNRALTPAEKSFTAPFYLTNIVGAADVAAGKARTCRGLTAIGADRVQITLDKPVSYFLYALSYPTGFVLKHTVPPGAKLTTDPSLVVGSGPFMLKDRTWQYRHQMTLVPNPYYYNARRIRLTEMDLVFVGSEDAAFAAYRSGQFPMAPLPAVEVPRYRGTSDFRETTVLGDMFYVMNLKVKPFDDRHFRRAVAFAINRDAVANGVDHGTVQPLYGWYPQGILGYDASIRNRVPHYDPARAVQELALARKEMGRIPTTVPLTYVAGNADQDREVQEVQRELKAVGIPIILHRVVLPADAVAYLHRTAFFWQEWYDDYPDPQDFSESVLGTGGGYNFGNYSNAQVDALFARADVARDTAKREQLYRTAQQIILNDAPVAMVYQVAAQAVISTKYHGVELNPSFGTYPQPLHNDWANVTVGP